MPRNARKNLPGSFYHIMSQGINKEFIFESDYLKQKYKNLLQMKTKDNFINIISYCIMDNHVHLMINTENNNNMTKFMHQVNTSYAKFYNKFHERVGFVFRNRYESKPILSEQQLIRCVVYIHKNPVAAGIVKKEEEYEYSSYNEYLNKNNKEKLLCENANKILFGKINEEQFREYYEYVHKHNNKNEFDDIEKEQKKDVKQIIEKYSNLTENQIIIKLKQDYNISERDLAKSFNQTRHKIRKILKSMGQQK